MSDNAQLNMRDKCLLAKLSAEDLVAQEAKYHAKCLTALYNKAQSSKIVEHGIALAELVSYIHESRSNDQIAVQFSNYVIKMICMIRTSNSLD